MEDWKKTRHCETCDMMFMPKYEWSKQCWNCWWSSPQGQAYAKRQAEQANGWDRGPEYEKHRHEQHRRENQQRQEQTWDWPGKRAASGGSGGTLDKVLLRKLIMLCHPDKHGGSEMSNAVTQELLKMRERLG